MNQIIENIINEVNKLNQKELNFIVEKILENPKVNKNLLKLPTMTIEEFQLIRFKNGIFCPWCENTNISKNGSINRRKRFICKKCNKTFDCLTNTIFANSNLSLDKWIQIIYYVILGFSLRKIEVLVNVSYVNIFKIRHKIMQNLNNYSRTNKLKNIKELDETYFKVSYKGNWTKSVHNPFNTINHKSIPVKKLRGISKQKVCVIVGIDSFKSTIIEVSNFGKPSTKNLLQILENRLDNNSIIITDSNSAYNRVIKNFNAVHIKIKTKKHFQDGFHNNNVNALHSMIKNWIRKFRGVATKYLQYYLNFFKFLNKNKKINSQNLVTHLLKIIIN